MNRSMYNDAKSIFPRMLLTGIALLLSIGLVGDANNQSNIMKEHEKTYSKIKTRLKLMTLNIAHGRKNHGYKFIMTESSVKENLDHICRVMERVQSDIIALQEADGSSFWSGNFDHIEYIRTNTSFDFAFHGEHVNNLKLAYGTAVLSKIPLTNSASENLESPGITFPKGYVVATIRWPGINPKKIDVLSIHLDSLRSKNRTHQLQQIVKEIKKRKNPAIIMGDFNCEWNDKNSAVKKLANELDLKPYRPSANNLDTYPLLNKRLDWILIPNDFTFISYKVLKEKISDHLAVVAEVEVK